MTPLTIVSEKDKKTRSFSGQLVAHIACTLWEGGRTATSVMRPVWAVVMSSEGQFGPLMANLRCGRKAFLGEGRYGKDPKDKMEFLRSARYSVVVQRTPLGSAGTLYLPELFVMDPGMIDPTMMQFALAIPRRDAAACAWDRGAALEHLNRIGRTIPEGQEGLVDMAPYMAAYVDRRTRCPLPTDTRFYVQLMYAALEAELLCGPDSRRYGLDCRGTDEVGLLPPHVFVATHERFEEFLAKEAAIFFSTSF